jgi:hypothetical protein
MQGKRETERKLTGHFWLLFTFARANAIFPYYTHTGRLECPVFRRLSSVLCSAYFHKVSF